MDTWTAVAIFVSVLGVVVILAVVWLFYKWRAQKYSRRKSQPRRSDSPVQRYVVVKGKLVPVPNPPPPTPKTTSGEASLKHTSWFLSSTSLHKTPNIKSSNLDTYEKGPDLEAGRQWRRDMDAIRSSRSTKWATYYHDSSTSTSSSSPKSPLPPPAAYRPITQKRPLVSKYSCSPILTRPSSTARVPSSRKRRPQIKPITIPEPARRASFLDSPSTESLRIHFPRPPYLPPLQSRYHKGPPYDSAILSTPTRRPDTWDSLQTASRMEITRAMRTASLAKLPPGDPKTPTLPSVRE